jgi:hypothetical protein
MPSITKSMRSALDDLTLDRLDIVYAGDETFALDRKVRALPLTRVLEDLDQLRPRWRV